MVLHTQPNGTYKIIIQWFCLRPLSFRRPPSEALQAIIGGHFKPLFKKETIKLFSVSEWRARGCSQGHVRLHREWGKE